MKKRVLSMFLMLTMVFSLIVVPQSAVAATYYDTVDLDCELAVDVLDALGIMGGYTDGSFLPYNTITKAEMASVAVKLVGIDGYSEEAPDDMVLFNDMYDYDGWAAGVIAMAKTVGIARADEDGNFNPDMSATYEDALQMVVSALGYGHQAQVRGGSLKDYVYIAQKMGITKKLDTAMGQNITRGDVAKLVYAALTVDLMLPVSYSADGTMVSYEAVEGKNALNTYFDVTEISGIITENEFAAIDGETTVEEEQILINDEVFDIGYTDIGDYLGYYATVYVLDAEDTADNRTVIAYTVKSVKNNTLTIEADCLEDVFYTPAEGYTFEYWANKDTDKKTKEAETSATPFVLYNGKAVIDVAVDLLWPENGHVVLIDNNGDDEYDIIDVWEYELVYVFAVSQSSGNVTSSYDRSATYRFDPNDEDYRVTFLNEYGGIAQLSDIKQYSVLYVYESVDKLEKKVVISNSRVFGIVTEASSEGFYTVNGVEYELSPAVASRIELAVSDEGDFYLDADNRIAGFEGTSVIRKNIGLFIDINDGGLRRGYQVKMLTQNSGVMIYNLATSVKVNDSRMTDAEFYELAFTDALFGKSADGGYSNNGMQRPHPSRAAFLYKLNSKGDISEVIVVGENDGYLQTRPVGTVKQGSDTMLYYSKNYGCLHYSQETVYDEVSKSNVGKRTYCDDKTVNFIVEEADYKNDNQSYYTKGMSTYWDNYHFKTYDWIYAYYYSDDETPIDMQKTACNFLVMADWYIESSDSTEDTDKNTYATHNQPDLAPKFILKVTEAFDKSANEETVRVYYFDGTSVRNQLVRPKYHLQGEGHVNNDINQPLLPSGFPVRISTDGSYIEDIAPYYDDSLYFDMYNMVTPIFNESTSSYVTPFMPFSQDQWRKWNSWDSESNKYNIRHYCGVITSIDEVVNNKLFSLAFAKSEFDGENGKEYDIEVLPNERLEGNVFKMNFDRTGNISSITRATLDDILPGQLVIVRKRAYNAGSPNWAALTGYAVNEFFIISEDAAELDYLKDFYDQVQEEIVAAEEN
ncbi:MAG: S-layer homology domain-containing protein [Clostridia bacterium]|nr:S-layer homology domain-containing protein [Clostridia bacterium]